VFHYEESESCTDDVIPAQCERAHCAVHPVNTQAHSAVSGSPVAVGEGGNQLTVDTDLTGELTELSLQLDKGRHNYNDNTGIHWSAAAYGHWAPLCFTLIMYPEPEREKTQWDYYCSKVPSLAALTKVEWGRK
jgi:hypothetical protein